MRLRFRVKWPEALAGMGERLRSQRQKKVKEAGPPSPQRPQSPSPRPAGRREGKGGLSSGTREKGAFGTPRSRLLIPLLLLLSVLGGVFLFKGRVSGPLPTAPAQGAPPPFEGSQPLQPPPPAIPATPPEGVSEGIGGEPPSIVYGVQPPVPTAPAPSSSQASPPAPVPINPASGGASAPSPMPSPGATASPPVSGSSAPNPPSPSPAEPSPNQAAPQKASRGAVSPSVPYAKKESEPSEGAQETASNSLTALLTPDLFAKPATKRQEGTVKTPVAVPPPAPPILPPLPSPTQPPPSLPPLPALAKVAPPAPPRPAGVLKGDGKLWVLLETASGMAEVEVGKDTFQKWRFELRGGEIYAITKVPTSEGGREGEAPSPKEVAYRLIQTESGFAWSLRGGKP